MSTRTLRVLAACGAAAFMAEGLMELAHHQADPFKSAIDYSTEAAFAVGLLATLAGWARLHRRIEPYARRTANWSIRVAAGGQGLLGLVALGTTLRGNDVLGPLFPLGVLAWVLGTLVYAVGIGRARILPAWQPVVLAVGTIAGIFVEPGGTLVLGAMWLLFTLAPVPVADRAFATP
jgi:hypothetical protein